MKTSSWTLFEQDKPDMPADLTVGPLDRFPVKVLQFGEGNFLRGFTDWMINRLNAAGCFNGSIAVVQSMGGDRVPLFNEQDCLYTLLLRGIENGRIVDRKEIITAISSCFDIHTEYEEYLKLAESPELRVIVSDTTEAGIVYSAQDRFDNAPPASFPGKLTVFLYRRFKAFGGDASKGFIIMPCELIERNGDNLREIVLRLAQEWSLGEDFISWVKDANYFLNTLVDDIAGLVTDHLFEIVSFGIEKALKALISEGHSQEKSKVLVINEKDNVAVAIEDIKEGERLAFKGGEITALEDIDKGHKVALMDIALNDDAIKYGFPIGHAIKPIAAGEYVHTHNIRTNLEGKLEYSYNPDSSQELTGPSCDKPAATFMGYLRPDGNVGIRNEIWIVNTVGCINNTSEILSREANIRFGGRTDGIFAFPHPYGCSQMGDDLLNTQRILTAMVRHPNAAGVLVLGLGCENNNIPEFKKLLGNYDPERVKFLTAQEVGDEIEDGLGLIGELVGYAEGFKRQECPVSRLVVGLKCGGSDAFSGITANPLVGEFSDLLIERGGTAVLTEVPEMFGAEMSLMNRCISNEVFDRTVELINCFKEYYIGHGQVIYDNPSPGNKKGGISTLEEKSLGCTQKGGTGTVTDVLEYGETVRKSGLNLLKGPGNDMIAATALMAAGAQLVLFTTGRGTPLGSPVPTVKISTNTDLFKRKNSWIDFDAGQLLEGRSMGHLSKDFFEYVMKVASGEYRTKNEMNGYREIAIFKNGVTL